MTKFTYCLETDEEGDGIGYQTEISKIVNPCSGTFWRMGWDDQIRGLKTIDIVHVRSGDGYDDELR